MAEKEAVSLRESGFFNIDFCAICDFPLENVFPKDFPDEFKFCCACLEWARSIIKDKTTEWLKHALKVSTNVKKIYERMMLYDGKRRK